MVDTTLCGYCVDLPEHGRAAATQVIRCPLCKAELGLTASGRRFRLAGADAPASPPARRHPILASLALIAAAACLAWLAWPALRPGAAPDIIPVVPDPVPYTEAPADVTEPPVPAAPKDVAQAKPYFEGVLSPEARAKPGDGPINTERVRAEVVIAPTADKVAAELPAQAKKLTGQVETARAAITIGEVEDKGKHEIMSAPEVALGEKPGGKKFTDPTEQIAAKKRITELAEKIQAKNGKEPDGFIRSLVEAPGDFAGLPFRLGPVCQLTTDQARQLAGNSLFIRDRLALNPPKPRQAKSKGPDGLPPSELDRAYTFWNMVGAPNPNHPYSASVPGWVEKGAASLLPVAMQILPAEHPAFRTSLVALFRERKDPGVTAVLARLALYDPDPEVRENARHALIDRPPEEYSALLLEALRYPWAPVAWRAANVAVMRGGEDLVPKLIDLLDELDPSEPFEHEARGEKVMAVRELVKVNHHRNCLLCHAPAPAKITRDVPASIVPSPAEPLPPSAGTVYSSQSPGETVVRADVTYLRQDFSVMLPVADAAPWPELQRFDFLVRTRVLTDVEVQVFQKFQQARGPAYLSPHRQAVLSALRRLTGIDAGTDAKAWVLALYVAPPAAGPAARWRIDCRK